MSDQTFGKAARQYWDELHAECTCDVCGALNVEIARVESCGIETFACAKCRGVEEEEQEDASK